MRYLLLFICSIVILFIVLSISKFISRLYNNETNQISINNHLINIEIVKNDTDRQKGLSGRKSLAQNSGMLFVFPNKGYHYFWMKEMQIPLDFIWIDGDKVVDLTENVSPLRKNSVNPSTFTSGYPTDKILEVNAGTVKKLNIKIGDTVKNKF